MPMSVFHVLQSSTLYQCGAECLMNRNCLSVSFMKKNKVCYLNSDDSNSGTIVHENGFVYSDITHWPKSLVGPCEDINCIPGSRCAVDRLKRSYCVAGAEHCGSPPSPGNGTVSYPLQSWGAIATYNCDDDYIYCGATTDIRCQQDGTWEEASTCEKSIWNVKISAFDIPCKSFDNFFLSLNASFTRETRFQLNVVRGSNLALHVSSRFNDEHGRFMVFNTNVNGVWGNRYGLHYMPLNVYLDGSHVITFDRTIQNMHPTYARVSGDVSLHQIEIKPMIF
ncbi:uncharacterized protein LOC124279592 [Haliotis rubra]|uniref:uncharacterized protein LOC124279592 n=1 Tax=Haliotis rubra TaxID=36100 RepID=UPI001EE5C3AB|nr:uncharacterized protein LOC124279592 [Haliotis rubra]